MECWIEYFRSDKRKFPYFFSTILWFMIIFQKIIKVIGDGSYFRRAEAWDRFDPFQNRSIFRGIFIQMIPASSKICLNFLDFPQAVHKCRFRSSLFHWRTNEDMRDAFSGNFLHLLLLNADSVFDKFINDEDNATLNTALSKPFLFQLTTFSDSYDFTTFTTTF